MACLKKVMKGGSYVYFIDFRYQGKRVIKSTKTSNLSLAKKILADIEGKIARGTYNLDEYDKKQIQLSKFFLEYFAYAKGYKAGTTISNEERYARKFVDYVGDRTLRSIDAQKLDMWKSHVLSSLSATTFNIERRFLHAAFNVAVKWKYLDKNPMTEIKKAKPQEKRLYFKADELAMVFNLIDEDVSKNRNPTLLLFRRYVEFLLLTGLRREEAIKLAPQDIDYTRNVVVIRKTKTKTLRLVPLHPRAKEILMVLDDSIFSALDPRYVSKKFGTYVRNAKLFDLKLHSLRHTFATNLIANGVDLYTVSRLLGHADIHTTMIYAKINTDTLQTAVAKLNVGVQSDGMDLSRAEK